MQLNTEKVKELTVGSVLMESKSLAQSIINGTTRGDLCVETAPLLVERIEDILKTDTYSALLEEEI